MNEVQKSKTPQKVKRSIQLSFAWYLNSIIIIVMGSGCFFLYKSLIQTLSSQKTKDVTALSFSELEKKAQNLSSHLYKTASINPGIYQINNKEKQLNLKENNGEKIFFQDQIDLDWNNLNPKFSYYFLYKGIPYSLRLYTPQVSGIDNTIQGLMVAIKALSFSDFTLAISGQKSTIKSYLVDQSGNLIYSTTKEIQNTNFAARPLVQNFVKTSFTRGQISFSDEQGQKTYGFYFEIPRSNLVIFFEIAAKEMLHEISEIKTSSAIIVFAIFLLSFSLIQFPINRIKHFFAAVEHYLREQLTGNIFASPPKTSILEIASINTLVKDFSNAWDQRHKIKEKEIRDFTEQLRFDQEHRFLRFRNQIHTLNEKKFLSHAPHVKIINLKAQHKAPNLIVVRPVGTSGSFLGAIIDFHMPIRDAELIYGGVYTQLAGDRTLLIDPEGELLSMMHSINSYFSDMLDLKPFASAHLFYFDKSSSILTLSQSGYGSCYIKPLNKTPFLYDLKASAPIGLDFTQSYSCKTYQVSEPTRILISSKGLTTHQNIKKKYFNAKKLLGILKADESLDLSNFSDQLVNEILRFSGIVSDDMSIVAMDIKP